MRVIVIGNGVAGVTAALSIRKQKPEWQITMISKESDFFFSRPALMYLYMGHMNFDDIKPFPDSHWDANRIDRVRTVVTGVSAAQKVVHTDSEGDLPFDKLIIATGAVANRFGWPGQDLTGVHGMVSLDELESLKNMGARLKNAVIVGGGLIGVELAEMLHSKGVGVTILAREPSYWINIMPEMESKMINRVIQNEGIDLRLETELDEVHGDAEGRATAVSTKNGERIECEFVGLTAGVSPNLSAVRESDIELGRGVMVDLSFRSTNREDVFAIGDCAEMVTPEGERNRIEQLWYTGKMHGELVADVICGRERTYDRGIWYNSAKFMDLEWHTYGFVSGGGGPAMVQGEEHLTWQDSGRRHSMRLVHKNGKLVGLNAMGIRYRHKVCESWIAKERDLEFVIDHLQDANFDPEFFKRYEPAMRAGFLEQIR